VNGHVLCTGMHRSGTTWVGGALSAAFHLRNAHEPSNPLSCRKVRDYYLAVKDPSELSAPFDYVLNRSMTSRFSSALSGYPRHWPRRISAASTYQATLVKDPFAMFNANLLAQHYGMAVVLCVRHPAGVVSSAMRLGWHFDFTNLLGQVRLTKELEPWRGEMTRRVNSQPDVLEDVGLLWKILHGWWRVTPNRPDFTCADHVALAESPSRLRDLLPSHDFDGSALEKYVASTQVQSGESDQKRYDDVRREPSTLTRPWRRRLAEQQLERLREITGDEAAHWGFTDDSW
jgi:hypothetical protein